jgi:3-hydroxyisobutyrate dehydrogenase
MASPEAGGTQRPRAAVLGLGIMGRPMAANLARAGIETVVWNRTRAKAEELAAEHETVTVADTPAAAAAAAGTAISMVPDAPQVEAVLLGEDGAIAGLPEGGLAIDMSTIGPSASRRIGAQLAERSIAFLDAPVTGSRPKAEDGTLTIMAGGEEEAFDRARPLFEAMGELVLHVGPQGHGSLAKLVNNTLAAVNAAALAEGLTLARTAGLDVGAALKVVAAGSGESAMRTLKAGAMIDGDFEPLFKLEHMLKDIRLFVAEARELGLHPQVAEAALGRYAQAAASGLGERDFAAVMEAVQP